MATGSNMLDAMNEKTRMPHEKIDRNAAIQQRYRDKASLRTIGVEFDISHERARQIVARVPGLLRGGRFKRRELDLKKVARLAAKGVTLPEIAEQVGMAETNLRVRMREAGISLKRARA